MLYELCTFKHPFTGNNFASISLKIIRGKYDPIPSCYSKDLNFVLEKCMQKDTRKRPSIHDLLEMDAIKSKAKILGLKIPTKEQVEALIESQK